MRRGHELEGRGPEEVRGSSVRKAPAETRDVGSEGQRRVDRGGRQVEGVGAGSRSGYRVSGESEVHRVSLAGPEKGPGVGL